MCWSYLSRFLFLFIWDAWEAGFFAADCVRFTLTVRKSLK